VDDTQRIGRVAVLVHKGEVNVFVGLLDKLRDRLALGRLREDDDVVKARAVQRVQRVLKQRLVGDVEQRLGVRGIGKRVEARSKSAGKHHHLELGGNVGHCTSSSSSSSKTRNGPRGWITELWTADMDEMDVDEVAGGGATATQSSQKNGSVRLWLCRAGVTLFPRTPP